MSLVLPETQYHDQIKEKGKLSLYQMAKLSLKAKDDFKTFCSIVSVNGINKLTYCGYMENMFKRYKDKQSFLIMSPRQTYFTTTVLLIILHHMIYNESEDPIYIKIVGKSRVESKMQLAKFKEFKLDLFGELGKTNDTEHIVFKSNLTGKTSHIVIDDTLKNNGDFSKYDIVLYDECMDADNIDNDDSLFNFGKIYSYRITVDKQYKMLTKRTLYIPEWYRIFNSELSILTYMTHTCKELHDNKDIIARELFMYIDGGRTNPYIESICNNEALKDIVIPVGICSDGLSAAITGIYLNRFPTE